MVFFSVKLITISKFPSSWWDSVGAGNADVNVKQRLITDRNEGVSIVRAGRETLFGDIPYFKIVDRVQAKDILLKLIDGQELKYHLNVTQMIYLEWRVIKQDF